MNKIKVIEPLIFRNYDNVKCAISTRNGGVSPPPFGLNLSYRVGDKKEYVDKNRELFFGYTGIPSGRVSYQLQVHSSDSNFVSDVSFFANSDALYTNVPGNYLAISIADCIPVFLYFPSARFIAAIHSGWRGTNQMITKKTIFKIKKEYKLNAEECLAYIGPGISFRNFKVNRDVFGLFDDSVKEVRNGEYYVDLKKEIYMQLTDSGLRKGNIEVSDLCTVREKETFHSFRRDGNSSGRMLAVIGLKY